MRYEKKNNISPKGIYDMWVASCQDQGKELFLLEESNGVKLFKLQTYFWNRHQRWPESPTYHVWVGDKWVCATLCYNEAFKAFEKTKKEETKVNENRG